MAASKRAHAARAAKEVVVGITAELIFGEVILPREQTKVGWLYHGSPRAGFGADRAIALAGTRTEIEVYFKRHLATVAASAMGFLHRLILR